MKYRIILENVGGKLDDRSVNVNDDPELLEQVIDFLTEIGSLRDGDTIRIIEEQSNATA